MLFTLFLFNFFGIILLSTLFTFLQALHAYRKKHGSLPKPYNKEDAAKFLEEAKVVNEGAKAKVCSIA